jgi:CBS domain-containing protein
MGRRILGRWNKAAVDNPVYLTETRWRAHDKMGIERFRRIAVQDEKRLIGIRTGRDKRQHLGQLAQRRIDGVMRFPSVLSLPIEKALISKIHPFGASVVPALPRIRLDIAIPLEAVGRRLLTCHTRSFAALMAVDMK